MIQKHSTTNTYTMSPNTDVAADVVDTVDINKYTEIIFENLNFIEETRRTVLF